MKNLIFSFFNKLRKSRPQQHSEKSETKTVADLSADKLSSNIISINSNPSSLPPTASSINKNGVIGPDGVLQIYPSLPGGSNFYLGLNPDKSKFNVSFGRGSHLPYSSKLEGNFTYFNTSGSAISYHSGQPAGCSVRLDVYPDGGLWANHTPYSYKDNPGYLYSPNGIASGEYTVYLRPHASLGTHQACVWKLAGRDEDDIRSAFEIGAADAKHSTPFANYNYTHYAYHKVPINIFPHRRVTPGEWYGIKAIRIVHPTRKSCDFYLYEDDPIVNGRPTNNWKLIAYYHDAGDKDMGGIACTWKSHKDLVRVDGFQSVDFALLSTRSINVGWPSEQRTQ